MNPYAPTTSGDTAHSGISRFALIWNTIVCILLIGLCVVFIQFMFENLVREFDTRTGGPGEILFVARLFAQNLRFIAGSCWILTGISTFPLHRKPILTRFISVFLCLAAAFDFFSMTFNQSASPMMVFAAMMSPMLLFGCGYQRCVYVALQFIRNTIFNRGQR